MMNDPFSEFRTSQPSLFDAATGSDGRSLSLTAIDVARFYHVAHDAIVIANKHAWRIAIDRRHPGGNISSLTISPRR